MCVMKLNKDCRQVLWDRPCVPHKREGVHCDGCAHYDPVEERILIVKLDALGDVLRTTCILPALREKYPNAQVSWITMAGAIPLLENNPFVDRRIPYDPEAIALLGVEEFDIVLGLDASPKSAALASLAIAGEKKGYGIDRDGRVFPFTPEAEQWFLMGLFDDLKKENRRTYQEIMMEICGLAGAPREIVIRLTDGEREFAGIFAGKAGLSSAAAREKEGVRVVGVNTASGSRWPTKQWPIEHCAAFIRALSSDENIRVLLFGGEDEIDRNRVIMGAVNEDVIDTGCSNSLREFAALVDLCDLVVSTDTLGLHVALGLGKKVVGLFGPTPAAEINVYGRGVKLATELDCGCCYLKDCGKSPACMETISPERVAGAVRELL